MDIVVVGAGLAGLRAAGLLRRDGHAVTVVEASSVPGGRVATDMVDGFRCDRGFQLLNTGYPEAKRALDLAALDLHPFGRGVAVRDDTGVEVLADPSRHPARMLGLLRGTVSMGDLKAAYQWAQLSKDEDLTLAQSITDAGFTTPLRRVIERFFEGVVGDRELGVSARFGRQLAWYFVKGTPSLPGQGMAALAHQLAEPVRDIIRFDTPVTSVEQSAGRWEVLTDAGEQFPADRVILAAGPRNSAQLLGQEPPVMHSLTTWWFATSQSPHDLPFLFVDVRDDTVLTNCAVVSTIAPSYAPAGQHLVQATAVGAHGLDDDEALARAADTMRVHDPDWRLLVRHDIHDALPAITPTSTPLTSPHAHLIVAGDTHEASIQGAMASGAAARDLVVAGR